MYIRNGKQIWLVFKFSLELKSCLPQKEKKFFLFEVERKDEKFGKSQRNANALNKKLPRSFQQREQKRERERARTGVCVCVYLQKPMVKITSELSLSLTLTFAEYLQTKKYAKKLNYNILFSNLYFGAIFLLEPSFLREK